ncbi:DUF3397 domain-containing protein [Paenibacillus naphthalenovorans]|uniref:Uncharacterized protein n=1 Tax=Paenibacillus naphthalenovorans TaxID=162209 RepID=A0A0U2ILS7_9BACL|nr:DUF3397 domain-containing protein [Paenibacillus naphthalenovorans]ALS21355.1 hypothetical protein IJ22_09730 [Paenibacillus naphthalenovorans]GCL72613.1 DUF3397 domain-containing protein [Paenibacillus naphthalenovorans]SDH95784.1 Protein of unknown function [Paenibacillus naphthalenovorans]
MNEILEWLHQLYKVIAFVPFVAFLITWLIVYYGCGRNKRKATYVSMDITTLFLIGSVAYMSRNLFGSGMLLWTIILFFLIAAGLLGNLQNRIKGRIDLVKIVRTLGRLGFLLLGACYVLLLFFGIGKYMISS